MISIRDFIYHHRRLGKAFIAASRRLLPERMHKHIRSLAERAAFALTPQYQGETLPPIFLYWAEHYVSPAASQLGISSPEMLYLEGIERACQVGSRKVRVMSLGCGAGVMEIGLASRLRTANHDFEITCLDLNPSLVRSAREEVARLGLSEHIHFDVLDCNKPFERPGNHIIIVNQFFHHVTELEVFCESLRKSLAKGGRLLTSDVIGRNGHQPWPATQQRIDEIWSQLPQPKRFDRHTGKHEQSFIPVNHAAYSNEGVRAQDIVACLLQKFDFELFFSFGGAIMPFVDRRFGFNFSPNDDDDCQIIDRIATDDIEALNSGIYPPCNMIGLLCHKGDAFDTKHSPITPEVYVQRVQEQMSLVARNGR